jgi:RND family efflux transporter MFP subunit
MLGDTYIKSTISGYVGTRDVETGATVGPGSKIAQIVDVSKFKINIMVSENDIVRLKPGKEVNVRVDALPGKTFEGKVSTIGMSSSNGLRSYPVEVMIENKSNDIKSGMFARCEIISDTKQNALVVPEKAVVMNNDGTSKVYVLEDGKAYERPVVLGIKSEGKYEIASGINAGEKVITTGKERLTDGIRVREK